MHNKHLGKVLGVMMLGVSFLSSPAYAAASGSVETIRQALFGAGVGAISAEASGGKAGKGALIGAGVNVIGQALMSLLTGPSQTQPAYTQSTYSQPVYQQPVYQQPVYTHPAPPTQTVQRYYTYDTPIYTQPSAPVYYTSAPYEDPNKRVLKQGLMGAGVGAISAEVSGGKAGTGALVGAGTNVIGSALLELLTS